MSETRSKSTPPTDGPAHWSSDIIEVLEDYDVRHVAYVPDAGHAEVIRWAEAEPAVTATVLTTEEEGIGYLLGAWLGGERGVLLMQSSGAGNCTNTLALWPCVRFPLLTLVTMRGEWAEFNPWQIPMGQATEPTLRLMGLQTWRADVPAEVGPLVRGAAEMAYAGEIGAAVLLGQRLIGQKKWVK